MHLRELSYCISRYVIHIDTNKLVEDNEVDYKRAAADKVESEFCLELQCDKSCIVNDRLIITYFDDFITILLEIHRFR